MRKINEELSLNSEELEKFIEEIIETNNILQENNKNPIAVEIKGPAGLGKTSIVEQIAKKKGKPFIKLNLAQIEEIGDLVGIPIKEIEICKKDKDGNSKECIWVIESTINEYLNLGYSCTGKTRMGYAPPTWIVGKENGGILLLDDYTRADLRFIQACMELIRRQEYISWKLPKGWTIILTSNPSNGNYMVNEMDDAHTTRFISVNLKWDVNCWSKYAEFNGIDSRCINFILLNSDLMESSDKSSTVNPRTIEMFFNLISKYKDFSDPDTLFKINTLGSACVGSTFADTFSMFINNKLDKLPTPDYIMFDKNEEKLIEELRNLVNSSKKYRSDIASVLSRRIINFSLNYAKNNPIKQEYITRLKNVLTDNKIFTVDIGYNAIRIIFNENNKFRSITLDKKISDIIKV